jgi:hypothetical protein
MSSFGAQYSCGIRYARTRDPSGDSHQKMGASSSFSFGPGRRKTYESQPLFARICGIVALWPNESRFAPTVAVIPNVSRRYRWP